MPQSQLSPLVGSEHEQPSGLGDDGGVLVAAAQLHHLVLPDPELGRDVVSELGLAEGEDGARRGHLGLVHLVEYKRKNGLRNLRQLRLVWSQCQ